MSCEAKGQPHLRPGLGTPCLSSSASSRISAPDITVVAPHAAHAAQSFQPSCCQPASHIGDLHEPGKPGKVGWNNDLHLRVCASARLLADIAGMFVCFDTYESGG